MGSTDRRAANERVGFKPIYDYALHNWYEDWDTPAAELEAHAILDALAAYDLIVIEGPPVTGEELRRLLEHRDVQKMKRDFGG